jgi:hypothetical protein
MKAGVWLILAAVVLLAACEPQGECIRTERKLIPVGRILVPMDVCVEYK